VGLLTMALLEMIKSLSGWRRSFNQSRFEQVIRDNVTALGKMELVVGAERFCPKADYVLKQVVMLSTAGNEKALYDLRVAQFIGQIGAALKLGIAYPSVYPEVVTGLAIGARKEDLETLLADLPEDESGRKAFTEARTRVTAIAQRSLDALQLDLSTRWADRQHQAAVVLSIAVIAVGVFSYWGAVDRPDAVTFVFWAVVAILGGVTAPVASDLVKLLRNVKQRAR
jgi:hypothetical protein